MNHVKTAARFSVVIFWLLFFGVLYSAFQNSGNAHALSWATWLFYAVAVSFIGYVGFFVSKYLWSIK